MTCHPHPSQFVLDGIAFSQVAQGLGQRIDINFKAALDDPNGERHFCEEVSVALENGDVTKLAVTGTVLGAEAFDRAPQQQGRGVRLVSVNDLATTQKKPLPPISV